MNAGLCTLICNLICTYVRVMHVLPRGLIWHQFDFPSFLLWRHFLAPENHIVHTVYIFKKTSVGRWHGGGLVLAHNAVNSSLLPSPLSLASIVTSKNMVSITS